jgi:hypothetical protein
MTNEDMAKFGKGGIGMAVNSFGGCAKGTQAIAMEVLDYSKRAAESSAVAWEKLMAAKSLESALQVQSQYMKSSYEDFVAEATRLGELYVDLAKEAYTGFEGALASVSAAK